MQKCVYILYVCMYNGEGGTPTWPCSNGYKLNTLITGKISIHGSHVGKMFQNSEYQLRPAQLLLLEVIWRIWFVSLLGVLLGNFDPLVYWKVITWLTLETIVSSIDNLIKKNLIHLHFLRTDITWNNGMPLYVYIYKLSL